jgi:hypothetical protein
MNEINVFSVLSSLSRKPLGFSFRFERSRIGGSERHRACVEARLIAQHRQCVPK